MSLWLRSGGLGRRRSRAALDPHELITSPTLSENTDRNLHDPRIFGDTGVRISNIGAPRF